MDIELRNRMAQVEQDLLAVIEESERRLEARRIIPTFPWHVRPTLLYLFMQLFAVLGRNVCVTTYVERGWNEYFAGFSNAYMLEIPARDGRRMVGYRWLSMSLIFRASRSTPF
ncbi:uncharacterized protein LOC110191259 [Drosophila serrata]|uniref:uncharacterized protein LOC110191259 n=1 Tax=Drosophila serrata TaxID=7274 RepID=UPI000A1CFEDB|nr:uncharacterized protein LOC110191259 [Drosophila serrata]